MEDSVMEIRVKNIIYLIINISRRNSQNSFNLGKVLLFLLIHIPESGKYLPKAIYRYGG
jgi:hypothetical protein